MQYAAFDSHGVYGLGRTKLEALQTARRLYPHLKRDFILAPVAAEDAEAIERDGLRSFWPVFGRGGSMVRKTISPEAYGKALRAALARM
jgi:hypothetical protein